MADTLGPNPGFLFREGSEREGPEYFTELIRIIERDESTTLPGRTKKMPAQADSTAATVADLRTDFNALLAALKTAGKMET